MRKILLLLFFLFIIPSALSQTYINETSIELGYNYFRHNQFKIGARYIYYKPLTRSFILKTLLSESTNQKSLISTMPISIAAYANMGYYNGKFVVIPEASVGIYKMSGTVIIPGIKGSISPYTITPEAAFSFAGLFEIGAGYGFKMTDKALFNTNGFRINFTLSVPLHKEKSYHLFK